MKTIEERAKEYAKIYEGSFGIEIAFIRGAMSENKELTCWNDLKKYPPDAHTVLVKIENADGSIKYAVGCNVYGRWQGRGIGNFDNIVGWREIHE